LNFCRFRISIISRSAAALTASPCAIFHSSAASPARRGHVVHALVERFLIFDAAQDGHAGTAQAIDRRLHVLRADALDQQVGREVAAHGDHRLAQRAQRHRLADLLVDLGVGVVPHVHLVDAAVDDAVEFVADGQRVIELQRSLMRLAEQLDHHRDLHGAGGVKAPVAVDDQIAASIGRYDRDTHLRPALGDQRLEAGLQVDSGSLRHEQCQQEPRHRPECILERCLGADSPERA
jgi:hypothetical protein